MCGITGIVAQRNIGAELFEGMQNLEYRGYDSAGMAVLCDGRLEVRKDAGKLAEVEGSSSSRPCVVRSVLPTPAGHAGVSVRQMRIRMSVRMGALPLCTMA